MTTRSNFIRVWRDWIRSPIPITNSRLRNGKAVTYGLELLVDHHYGYATGLCDRVISGATSFDSARFDDALADVDEIADLLESLHLSTSEAGPFTDYVARARELLALAKEVHAASPPN